MMDAEGKVRAALPDSGFVQLDELYRDRMKQRLPLRIDAVDVPAAGIRRARPRRTGYSPDAARACFVSSTSIGTPGSCFELRIASADFTWLTFGAGVRFVVRNF